MKAEIFKLTLSVLLLCTMAGCTSQLYINTIRPPVVAIDNNQWKVVLMNRFNPDLLPFDRERKIDVFTKGAYYAFQGALQAVYDDSTYLVVQLDTSNFLPPTPLLPLDASQAAYLYEQHPHHLILALENIEIFMEQETDREKDDEGNVSKTAYYTLVTRTHWALYDSTARILDKTILEEKTFYQSRAVISGLLAVGPSLGKAGDAVNQLAWDSGYQYWQRLSPQPISYIRPYYSMKNLEAAAALMAIQDWPAAIIALKPIAEGGTKDAARAAYNLAVIYEAMGNMAEARRWAQQAKNSNNRLALLYYASY